MRDGVCLLMVIRRCRGGRSCKEDLRIDFVRVVKYECPGLLSQFYNDFIFCSLLLVLTSFDHY